MAKPEFEYPQPFHNPLRTYEYIANQADNAPMPSPGMGYPYSYPAYPMPAHLYPGPTHGDLDAYASQYSMGHPHPPPGDPMIMMPPPPPPPGYGPAMYPYGPYHPPPPPPWAYNHPPPPSAGPHGSDWMGQSKREAHASQMREAAKKAAAAKEATDNWKPDADVDDMFWCISGDGGKYKDLLSFATISTFKGRWLRGYDGIAYFVREEEKKKGDS